jgi:hypothetical protein
VTLGAFVLLLVVVVVAGLVLYVIETEAPISPAVKAILRVIILLGLLLYLLRSVGVV